MCLRTWGDVGAPGARSGGAPSWCAGARWERELGGALASAARSVAARHAYGRALRKVGASQGVRIRAHLRSCAGVASGGRVGHRGCADRYMTRLRRARSGKPLLCHRLQPMSGLLCAELHGNAAAGPP